VEEIVRFVKYLNGYYSVKSFTIVVAINQNTIREYKFIEEGYVGIMAEGFKFIEEGFKNKNELFSFIFTPIVKSPTTKFVSRVTHTYIIITKITFIGTKLRINLQ